MPAAPVIITDAVSVAKRVKTRAKRIIIDNPIDGDQSVYFEVEEHVLLDDVPTAGYRGAPDLSRVIASVATKTVTVTDPVTGEDVTVSVAGVATAIQALFVDWFNEDKAAREA